MRRPPCADPSPQLVVCDLSASPVMDVSGARMLRQLQAWLEPRGARLAVMGAHGYVRDVLQRDGVAALIGHVEHGGVIEAAPAPTAPARPS